MASTTYSYTSTDDGNSWDEILRRIQAGLGGIIAGGGAPAGPLPPAYNVPAATGPTTNDLLLIGLVVLAVYLMTR